MVADTIYEVIIQNISVPLKPFLLLSSAFAVATAAKQGMVVMLNAMNDKSAGTVMLVAEIICITAETPPSVSVSIIAPAIQPAKVPNVAITFSFFAAFA